MVEAYLGFGGNVGNVCATLAAAVDRFCDRTSVQLLARSANYLTPPWGMVEQPPFVNLCIAVATDLSPQELLARALAVEREFGRVRTPGERWGPRPLDIDILAYDDMAVNRSDLVLPHPHLHERAFVLVPLSEIRPNLVIGGIPISDSLAGLDRSGIERLGALS